MAVDLRRELPGDSIGARLFDGLECTLSIAGVTVAFEGSSVEYAGVAPDSIRDVRLTLTLRVERGSRSARVLSMATLSSRAVRNLWAPASDDVERRLGDALAERAARWEDFESATWALEDFAARAALDALLPPRSAFPWLTWVAELDGALDSVLVSVQRGDHRAELHWIELDCRHTLEEAGAVRLIIRLVIWREDGPDREIVDVKEQSIYFHSCDPELWTREGPDLVDPRVQACIDTWRLQLAAPLAYADAQTLMPHDIIPERDLPASLAALARPESRLRPRRPRVCPFKPLAEALRRRVESTHPGLLGGVAMGAYALFARSAETGLQLVLAPPRGRAIVIAWRDTVAQDRVRALDGDVARLREALRWIVDQRREWDAELPDTALAAFDEFATPDGRDTEPPPLDDARIQRLMDADILSDVRRVDRYHAMLRAVIDRRFEA